MHDWVVEHFPGPQHRSLLEGLSQLITHHAFITQTASTSGRPIRVCSHWVEVNSSTENTCAGGRPLRVCSHLVQHVAADSPVGLLTHLLQVSGPPLPGGHTRLNGGGWVDLPQQVHKGWTGLPCRAACCPYVHAPVDSLGGRSHVVVLGARPCWARTGAIRGLPVGVDHAMHKLGAIRADSQPRRSRAPPPWWAAQ